MPSGDQHVGARQPPRSSAGGRNRTALHTAPPMITSDATPDATPASTRGSGPKTSLPCGSVSATIGAVQRRHDHHAGTERAAKAWTPAATRSADGERAEQVDRAEGQERHVDDRRRTGRRAGTRRRSSRRRRRPTGRPTPAQNRNSATVHATSWGLRRSSHRSSVDSAKASDSERRPRTASARMAGSSGRRAMSAARRALVNLCTHP